ncbi:hypothetical protein ACOI22_07405 [Glaciecola sp. 2405UD65-10]|uniref:hypothetical protein n=1 Tax=Glaciecola sp. 2405UD65-10 TaxID=3397244 RepID=UPI003B58BB0F
MKTLLIALSLLVGFSANANIISVSVDNTEVQVGESIDASVVVDMTDAFDTLYFELEFDTSVFEYDANSFSSNLDFAFIAELTSQTYGVSFYMLDFIGAFPSNYVASSFSLTAISEGVTSFDIVSFVAGLGGSDTATPISIDTTVPTTTEVSPAVVSAPSAIALFAAAVLAFAGFRRKA